MKVLFVNSKEPQCGVYQMGKRIGAALISCSSFMVTYAEVDGNDYAALSAVIVGHEPDEVIYNFHPATLPLATTINREFPGLGHGAVIHEITHEEVLSGRYQGVFGAIMIADPTAPTNGKDSFRCPRPLPYRPISKAQRPANGTTVIGSFGFATNGKGFERIIEQGVKEFGRDVTFRFIIPAARYGDPLGKEAHRIAKVLREMGDKAGVVVDVSNRFHNDTQLIRWLEFNDLNAFLYSQQTNRGVASAPDFAIAAMRPLIVSDSQMFRHLHNYIPQYPRDTFRDAIQSGDDYVNHLYEQWTWNALAGSFDTMISQLLRTKVRP